MSERRIFDALSAPASGWLRLLAHFPDYSKPADFFDRVAILANTPTGGTFTEIVGDGPEPTLLIIEGVTDADRLGALSYLANIVRNTPHLDPVVVAACVAFEDGELWRPLSEFAYGANVGVQSEGARILGCALLDSLYAVGVLPKPHCGSDPNV